MQFIAVPAGKRAQDYYKEKGVNFATIFGARNSFRLTARIGQPGSVLAQTKPGLKSSGPNSALFRFRPRRAAPLRIDSIGRTPERWASGPQKAK